MIRIGLLGASKIAPKAIIWPAGKREDCRIEAVSARDLGKAQDYAREHDIPIAINDYDALCSHPDVDLIYNALPPNRHAEYSIKALKAGKYVLCEKPFAMNADEAEKMVTADTGRRLFEALHYRFHPAFLYFQELIASGKIGKITKMSSCFNVDIPQRPGELRHEAELGGGAMMDLGCYSLHAMRVIAGAEPEILQASSVEGYPRTDLRTVAKLDFSGIQAELETDMRGKLDRQIDLRITGESGTALMRGFVHPYRDVEITVETQDGTDTVRLNHHHDWETTTTYDAQLSQIMDVIAGRTEPLTGGQDAIDNMSAIDAIYRATGLDPR